MRTTSLLLLFCMVLMLTGCPKGLYSTRPSTKLGEDKLLTSINTYLKDRQVVYYCVINGGTANYNVDTKKQAVLYTCNTSAGVVPADEKNKEIAKRIRNEMLENGVTAIDSIYNNFIDDLNTGRATTNFVADVIDLGVGAAVGITKGERALQILGVSLTAFRGGRKSIDVNFFREQTVPILANKMDDNRAKVYSEILQKKDRSVDAYQMEEAIRDIVRYFNAGTLVRAFGELAKDTAAKAKSNEEKLLTIKGLNSLDKIPAAEEVDLTREIFQQLRDINTKLAIDPQSTDTTLQNDRKAAEKRIGQIFDLVNNDTFKTTIETLKTKDEFKTIFEKMKNKTALSSTDKYTFVDGIFEYTEGNSDLRKKLKDIFAATKP